MDGLLVEEKRDFYFPSTRDLVEKASREIKTSSQNEADSVCYLRGISTGFVDLDKITGGISQGIMVIGARPEISMTDFALNIMSSASRQGKVLYFTFNRSPEDLVRKLFLIESGIHLLNRNEGLISTTEGRKAHSTTCSLTSRENNITFSERPLDAMNLYNQCENRKKTRGLDLVIIDTFQALLPSVGYGGNSLYSNAKESAEVLSSIRSNLKIPIIVLSELKKIEEGQRIKSSHLRDFGVLEYLASPFLLIEKEEADEDFANESFRFSSECFPIRVNIGNNFNGLGNAVCRLTYLESCGRFESAAKAD